jgi:transcriptional regulator with XRE-family HTH domain
MALRKIRLKGREAFVARGPLSQREFQQALGNEVRKLRTQRELTQAALGREAGIDRGDISKLENGRIDLRLSSIRRIARALGISVSRLLETVER